MSFMTNLLKWRVARFNATGTALVDPVTGVPSDYLSTPGKIPNGLDWITETLHGFDIYKRGFVQRPTLFFDPTATSSLNRGTFQHPYNTATALQAAIKGDMRGQVLGFKRGTTLNVTNGAGLGNTVGLRLQAYGTSSDPFIICPYGDAEALPIITGERATGTGTSYVWTLHSGNVYKITVAYDTDLWENGVRCMKKGTTPANPGEAQYTGGVLYYYPRDVSAINTGSVKINLTFDVLHIAPDNVAASGYIQVAGLDVRMARNRALDLSPLITAYANITSIAGIRLAGCRIGMNGRDMASYAGDGNNSNAAVSFSGVSDTVRMTAHVVGCEAYDAINNAFEYSATDGLVHEHNYGHDCGGYTVAELYASNVNSHIRYSVGKRATTKYSDGSNFLCVGAGYGAGGIWLASNFKMASAFTATAVSAAEQVNNTNKAYFNYMEDVQQRFVRNQNGTGHVIAHNTMVTNSAANGGDSRYWSNIGFQYDGDAAAGHTTQSNNLIYNDSPAGVFPVHIRLVSATTNLPAGDKNVYFCVNLAGGAASWYSTSAVSTGNFTTYKTNVAAAGLDQNSFAGVNCAGANLSVVQLAWDNNKKAPAAGSTILSAGVTSLTDIGTRYKDGQPYAAATPTIGCYLGG